MADDWVWGKVCSEFWGGVGDGVGVGDGDTDGIVFMCGCACDNDWFWDTCWDGILGVTCTLILPLPVECRPREDKVLPPLFVPVVVGVWVGDCDVDGIVFMCGDDVDCTCDNDWFGDTCGDGIIGVTSTTILPLPVECRPREDKVLPPLKC